MDEHENDQDPLQQIKKESRWERIVGTVLSGPRKALVRNGLRQRGNYHRLERELAAAGHNLRTADLRIVDPLRLWQKREPRKLTDAYYERFVGPLPDGLRAHDAGDDVRMTVAVIEAMAGGATVDELHAEGNPRMVDVGRKVRPRRAGTDRVRLRQAPRRLSRRAP